MDKEYLSIIILVSNMKKYLLDLYLSFNQTLDRKWWTWVHQLVSSSTWRKWRCLLSTLKSRLHWECSSVAVCRSKFWSGSKDSSDELHVDWPSAPSGEVYQYVWPIETPELLSRQKFTFLSFLKHAYSFFTHPLSVGDYCVISESGIFKCFFILIFR